mmetsp:Transcript_4225/g.7457  ORF Transcript_4225/g.7457 Transcript_4225/m.7457 type:complete len:156 (+) Transcript_4225:36-503(+)
MTPSSSAAFSSGRYLALRLRPGEYLKESLLHIASKNGLDAACIVSCVGSLEEAQLRLAGADIANKNQVRSFSERLEITSLVGTFGGGESPNCHLHLTVADKDGNAFGGHVLDGCKILTTAEVVLLDLTDVIFERRHDPSTGFSELAVVKKARARL